MSILIVLLTYVVGLYVARYLRPSAVKALLRADPPTFRSASLEAFGAKLGGELELNQKQNAQLASFEVRLENVEKSHEALNGVVVRILRRQGRDGIDAREHG